jgi:hypothetical protein
MLIALNGYIGSGKDAVAERIQYLDSKAQGFKGAWHDWYLTSDRGLYPTRWQIKKFAGKLKECASLLTGIPVADFEKPEVKNSLLGPEWNSFEWIGDKLFVEAGEQPMTVRTLLQRLGTEAIRDKVHQNAWVNALFADYQLKTVSSRPFHRTELLSEEGDGIKFSREYPNWVISDCRFENEAKAVKDKDGIVVRINRASSPKGTHASEVSLDNWEFDYVLDNSGSLEELPEKVRTMLLHFKII